jgi:hypothetical protein
MRRRYNKSTAATVILCKEGPPINERAARPHRWVMSATGTLSALIMRTWSSARVVYDVAFSLSNAVETKFHAARGHSPLALPRHAGT